MGIAWPLKTQRSTPETPPPTRDTSCLSKQFHTLEISIRVYGPLVAIIIQTTTVQDVPVPTSFIYICLIILAFSQDNLVGSRLPQTHCVAKENLKFLITPLPLSSWTTNMYLYAQFTANSVLKLFSEVFGASLINI